MPEKEVGDKMKILVLSDSHRNVNRMLCAVAQEQPDMVFHLGDLSRDAQELSDAWPKLPVLMVTGNCDAWGGGGSIAPGTLVETVDGVRLLLTHGHLYRAKSGPAGLLREGRKQGVDAVLYGHTHIPVAQRQEDGLWLINPGTIGGVGHEPTYALLQVEHGALSVALKEL